MNFKNFLYLPTPLLLTVILVLAVLVVPLQTLAAGDSSRATIAILSHTDFLPDATGEHDRRSSHGYSTGKAGLPEILADAILEQLAKSKRFIPVERKALRTAVLEQRFGKKIAASYLDRTLDKAIQDMDKFEIGGGLAAPSVIEGAKYNDLLHDFKDLGTAIGADYIVLGNLHQLKSEIRSEKIPLSEAGRSVDKKTAEARLRLRIIDAKTSTVIGADSLHIKVSSILFEGGRQSHDDFAFMEQVSQEAANKILDIVFPAKVVSVEPLIISRGSNDGITEGDQFTIVREGQEIKESSGMVIARLKSPIGQVRVNQVQETVAMVTPEQGSGFVKGDLAMRIRGEENMVNSQDHVPLRNETAGHGKTLPRVAIGLVKAGSTAITGDAAGKHIAAFTDTIITRLVQSKRFTVIDRQEVDQLLDEQSARALSENRDLASVMGTLKGCDYLVIGSVSNFSIEEQTLKLPNSSRIMTVLDGFAEGNIRFVNARTGDIMESRKISVRKQLDIQAGEVRLLASLADGFADQVAANLLNSIYPVKVAAVSPDGTVYINRGLDGMLSKGALFEVMRPGQKIIDPDTGVQLGTMNSSIGQIELTVIEENRSMGRVTGGSGISSGDILKLLATDNDRQNVPGKPQMTGGSLPGTVAFKSEEKNVTGKKTGGKATLALIGISLNARQKFDDNSKISAIQQGTMDQISDNIVDTLAKTNRFAMMERRQIDQLIDEKAFKSITGGGDIRDYLKEIEGADYLVAGELTNFYLHIRKKKVPYLDEYEISYTGIIEGNQRIIDGHTSRVIATEKVRLKKKFKNIGMEEIRTKLIDMYAADVANGIVQRIYPMKVLGVMADGTIFINRGADAGLKPGVSFTVERPGEELIDPDTGISFGAAETTIGTLEITSVEVARSRARMTSGTRVAAGDILRNHKEPAKPTAKKKMMKVAW